MKSSTTDPHVVLFLSMYLFGILTVAAPIFLSTNTFEKQYENGS